MLCVLSCSCRRCCVSFIESENGSISARGHRNNDASEKEAQTSDESFRVLPHLRLVSLFSRQVKIDIALPTSLLVTILHEIYIYQLEEE